MRIPSLDGLRAISIVFVIFGHMAECGLAPRFLERYASFGVHVFFVISGFLITTLLLREKQKHGALDPKAFYIRRALRILPAAYFFMAVIIMVYHISARHSLLAFTYFSNYDLGRPWAIGHLWSLGVEEQFYLLWPMVLILFYARSRAILAGTIIAAPLANIALHFAHLSSVIGTAFPSVADSLALGCLGAMLGTRRFRHSAFSFAAPLALLLQGLAAPAAVNVVILWPIIHVLMAFFVLHAVERRYALLNLKPLAWLGVMSYSLYLWQQPLLNPDHASFTKVILILPCAMMSYYCVELPFLRLKSRFATSKAKVAVGAA